jgi:hypothetical protein
MKKLIIVLGLCILSIFIHATTYITVSSLNGEAYFVGKFWVDTPYYDYDFNTGHKLSFTVKEYSDEFVFFGRLSIQSFQLDVKKYENGVSWYGDNYTEKKERKYVSVLCSSGLGMNFGRWDIFPFGLGIELDNFRPNLNFPLFINYSFDNLFMEFGANSIMSINGFLGGRGAKDIHFLTWHFGVGFKLD